MESIRTHTEVLALLFLIAASVQGDFVEPLEPVTSMRSLVDSQTRFPCHYKTEEEQKMVQVTWYKELPDGTRDNIIAAHFTDGQTKSGRYSRRVRFESTSPTENSALIFPTTEVSDEGTYICHISTFPNGNFERRIKLTVWSLPISSLDAAPLVEGQPFGVVASCRAVGRPLPRLSWETDIPGKSQNRTSEDGAVYSHYSLHPLRSMNGKKLDCLVWHPGLDKPRRISNRLVVHYPPDPTISPSDDLYVGQEKAELVCKGRGYPEAQNITWTRRDGALPDGVSVVGEKLIFERALRGDDSGVYECVAKNSAGVGSTEYTISVAGAFAGVYRPSEKELLIIIGSAAVAVVVILVIIVLLVYRSQWRKTRKLKRVLSDMIERESNLSRQASFRRLNSVNSDPRVLAEDGGLLRVNSRMKHSHMSLDRHTHRGSQSTLGGRWGPTGGVELDELGRPVIWGSAGMTLGATEMDAEEEECRRVDPLQKGSNMSLDSGLPSSLLPMKAQREESAGLREPDLGHLQDGDSPTEADSPPFRSVDEGHEDDEDDEDDEDNEESSPFQISAALDNYFYYRDGVLRPKPHSNAILLHPRPEVI